MRGAIKLVSEKPAAVPFVHLNRSAMRKSNLLCVKLYGT